MQNNTLWSSGELCVLHDDLWLSRQRIAGKALAKTLNLLENLVKEKTVKSLIELDKIAEQFILSQDCTATFKGYKGFPASICMSVQKQLVHGIPTDYKLQEGDLISFDSGCTFEGAIADSALTCIFGEAKSQKHLDLIKDTEEALYRGIKAIKLGDKVGSIGHSIYNYANNKGYGVITQYGGHTLSYNKPHDLPFIPNKGNINEGIRMMTGFTLCIEPLLVLGKSTKTRVLSDGWTVECDDLCAHAEHSLYLHEDGTVENITDRSFLKE
jgi:methionyl aminopeptidase